MNKYGWFINQKEDLLDVALSSRADAWTLIDANPECVRIAERVRSVRPNSKVVIRYYRPHTPLNQDPRFTARDDFYNRYSTHKHVTKMFYNMNEPQLETEGCNVNIEVSVRNMWLNLNVWMLAYVAEFRSLAPDAFIIFPPPCPANYWDEASQLNMEGFTLCAPAIAKCDAVAQNIYWPGSDDGRGIYFDKQWYAERYLKTYEATKKPIWISECNGNINSRNWTNQMVSFWQGCQSRSFVLGATCFLLQAHDGQFDQQDVSLRPNVGEDMATFARELGEKEMAEFTTLNEALRNSAWNAKGIAYTPNFALSSKARELGLGHPETNEFDFYFEGRAYRGQGFGVGVLFCEMGKWDVVYGPVSWS